MDSLPLKKQNSIFRLPKALKTLPVYAKIRKQLGNCFLWTGFASLIFLQYASDFFSLSNLKCSNTVAWTVYILKAIKFVHVSENILFLSMMFEKLSKMGTILNKVAFQNICLFEFASQRCCCFKLGMEYDGCKLKGALTIF